MQGFIIVVDDMLDHTEFRRGQPCWYLHDNIGLFAINDGIFIENSIYQLLKMHFRDKPCYIDLVETFQQVRHYWRTLHDTLGSSIYAYAAEFNF